MKTYKEKYFKWKNIPDNINIIISPKGYGKTYYELNKLIEENKKQKEVLDKIKEIVKNDINIDLEYPYYMEMQVEDYNKLKELLEEIE